MSGPVNSSASRQRELGAAGIGAGNRSCVLEQAKSGNWTGESGGSDVSQLKQEKVMVRELFPATKPATIDNQIGGSKS